MSSPQTSQQFQLSSPLKSRSLEGNKENKVQSQNILDRSICNNLKNEGRKRTKHESTSENKKYLAKNTASSSLFSQETTAGQCIEQIEKELIQLKRLTSYNNKKPVKETFTQTLDQNFNSKEDFANMKFTVIQMRKHMEELEALYKKDGRRIIELKEKIEDLKKELMNEKCRAENYKKEGEIKQMEEIIRKQKAIIEKLKRQVDSKEVFSEVLIQDKKQRNYHKKVHADKGQLMEDWILETEERK